MSNSSRFYFPFFQAFRATTGAVGAGWKLYFYQTGSSTVLQDTFSDAALTTPNANPVVADSSGRWPDIFLSTSSYNVVLKDENDVTIDAADPVQTPILTSGVTNLASDGTVSEPSYGYASDTNSGHYRIGPDNVGLSLGGTKAVDYSSSAIKFSIAGTEELTINGSTVAIPSNNVGIGTSSPSSALHVSKSFASPGSAQIVLRVTRLEDGTATAGNGASILFEAEDDAGVVRNAGLIGSRASNVATAGYDSDLEFRTVVANTLTERMRITSGGNVGIGTSSPGAKLDVESSSTTVADMTSTNTAAYIRFVNSGNNNGYIGTNSTGAMQLYTSNLVRATIDSSGNVGIGTTSPATALHVKGATNSNAMIVDATGTAPNYIFDVRDDGTTLFRVDPSGNVGIGTTSPDGLLTVRPSSGNAQLFIRTNDTTSISQLIFGDSADSNVGGLQYNHTDDSLQFHVGNIGEKARIDSSGNLLVGKTVTTFGTEGIRIGASGVAEFTRNSATPISVNRTTTDGNIITCFKNGSAVGRIGTASGYLFVGTTNTGMIFDDGTNQIYPWNPGANAGRDALIDIGTAGGRFKNLYLSGGAYIGGTGAANLLDDYEEGIWTPVLWDNTLSSGEGQTYSTATGTYTKIGRRVTAKCYITMSSLGTLTTSQGAKLGTLPVAASSTSNTHSTVSVGYAAGMSVTAGQVVSGYIIPNTSYITLQLWDATGGTSDLLISELTASGSLILEATYDV